MFSNEGDIDPSEIGGTDDDSTDDRCFTRRFNNAVEENDLEALIKYLKSPNRMYLLNNKDANNMNNTPLHMAINLRKKRKIDKNKNREIIEKLLSAGADTTIRNMNLETPLDLVKKLLIDLDRQMIECLFEQNLPSTSVWGTTEFEAHASLDISDDDYSIDFPNETVGPYMDSSFNTTSDLSFDSPIDTTLDTTTDTTLDTYSDQRTDPDLDSQLTYNASGVKRALDGIIYQAKLLGLFVIAGKENKYDFRLATEMDSAEKFDDVVFKYFDNKKQKWTIRFLQAKHKQDPKNDKIKISDLKSTSNKNPFSLQKYLISFCNIKDNECFKGLELRDFTIVTNTDFNFINRPKRNDKTSKADKTLRNKWASYFVSGSMKKNSASIGVKKSPPLRTPIENDEILYIPDKYKINFDAKEYRFSEKAKKELTMLIKSSLFKNADEAKIIANMNAIKDKITAIIYLNDKGEIDRASESVKNLQEACEKTIKITHIDKPAKVLTAFIKHRLNKEDNDEWKQTINSMRKIKQNIDNTNYRQNESWIEVVKEVSKKCKEFWEKANIQPTSTNSNELEEDLKKLNDAKNDFIRIRNETFNAARFEEMIQSIKKSCSKNEIVNDVLSKHLETIKKKWDVDEKRKLGKALDNSISEISLIQLALNDTNIDEYLKEFSEKFRFVVRYPNEEELGELIKEKLGEDFFLLNADLVSSSFEREMLEFLKNYSKGKSIFYSWKTTDDFFHELTGNIRTLMTSGLCKLYPEELKSFGLVVDKNMIELKDFLKNNDRIWHLQTKYTLLSAIKVLQTFESSEMRTEFPYLAKEDGYIFMPLKTMLLPKVQGLVIESFGSEKSHHILVVECQLKNKIDVKFIDSLGKEILGALKKRKNKRVLFIGQKNDVLAKKFESRSRSDRGIHFEDLTSDSRATVLNREVNFQGKLKPFEQLIDQDYIAPRVVDERSLNGMMTMVNENKLLRIGNTSAFYPDDNARDYYYKDRLLYRQRIKKEFFVRNIEKDLKKRWLFFITGASREDFINLGIAEKFIRVRTNKEKVYSNGFILHNSIEAATKQFDEICDQCTADSIFWLEYLSDDLFWRDYNKELSVFEFKYIEKNYIPNQKHKPNETSILKEEYFCSEHIFSQKVIILANDSGMGKSVALNSFARKMMKIGVNDMFSDLENDIFANLWIVRIDLREHAKDGKESCIQNIDTENWSDGDYIDFISKMCIPGSDKNIEIAIQRKLFATALECSEDINEQSKRPNILIQFDGFDEICSLSTSRKQFTYREKTTALLKVLKDHTNVIQLWVTTRTHEKEYLEKELKSPAYMLSPLTRDEQKEFSNEFWKWNLKKFDGKKANDACNKLISRLKEIQSSLKKYYSASDDKISADHELIFSLSENITPILEANKSNIKRNINHLDKLRDDISQLDFSPYVNLLLTQMNIEFTNVPLHLEMLVEVICEQEIDLTKPLGLVNLYRKFVDYKLRYYLERTEISDRNAPQAISFDDECNNLREQHIKEAAFIFDSLKTSNLITDDEKQKATKPGFLSLNDGKLEFVRPTFAEFFYSEFLVKNWKNKGTQMVLFEKLLIEDECAPIREFFNGQIELYLNYMEYKKELDKSLKNRHISKNDYKQQLLGHEGKHLEKLLEAKMNMEVGEKIGDPDGPEFLHILAKEYLTATIQFVLDKFYSLYKLDKNILKALIQKTDTNHRKSVLKLAVSSDSPGDCAGTVGVLLKCMKNCFEKDELNELFLPKESNEIDDTHESLLHITAIKLGKKKTVKVLLEWAKCNFERTTFENLLQANDTSGRTISDYASNELNLLPTSLSSEDYEEISDLLQSL